MFRVKLLLILFFTSKLFCMNLGEPKSFPIPKLSMFARFTALFISQDPFLALTEKSINHFCAIKCFENTLKKLTETYKGSCSLEKIRTGFSLQTQQGLMFETDEKGVPLFLISPWGLFSITISKMNDSDKEELGKDILRSLMGFWKQESQKYILQGIQNYTLPHEQTFIVRETVRSSQKVDQIWNQLEQYYFQRTQLNV